MIGDFSIPLAIIIMVVVDILIKETYTEVGTSALLKFLARQLNIRHGSTICTFLQLFWL